MAKENKKEKLIVKAKSEKPELNSESKKTENSSEKSKKKVNSKKKTEKPQVELGIATRGRVFTGTVISDKMTKKKFFQIQRTYKS